MLNHLIPALFVVMGTSLQMWLSLLEVGRSRRDALAHKRAEDDLIAELPRLQRRRTRRDFIRDREPQVHQAIREAWFHLLSWALLFGAACTAAFDVAIGN